MSHKFTSIKGLSERRRLPRLGIIRLGIKVKHKQNCECRTLEGCLKCTRPKETEYLVLPPVLRKLYGDTPMEIPVMLPPVPREEVASQSYRCYGSTRGLKCTGDGEKAERLNDETGEWQERACPTPGPESGDALCLACKARGFLYVMVPEYSMGGVFQVGTGSVNAIVDVNSALDYVQGLLGRWQLVPLLLKRVKIETHHDGKKSTHYPVTLEFRADIALTNSLREDTKRILAGPTMALPPVEEEHDALTEEAAEVIEQATPLPDTPRANGAAEEPALPQSPPPPATAEARITHGKNKDLAIKDLTDDQLAWYVGWYAPEGKHADPFVHGALVAEVERRMERDRAGAGKGDKCVI